MFKTKDLSKGTMMRLPVLLLTFTLIVTATHMQSMELLTQSHRQILFNLPEEEETIFIFDIAAYCEAKDALRQTCKYLNHFISQKKENLLKHTSLRLTKKALTKFAFYYGQLGDSEIVINLLQKGFDPNTEKSEGNRKTLFHYAAQYGYVDIANALLANPKLCKNAVIEREAFKGIECPLSFAIEYDQDIIVKNILTTCRSAGDIDDTAVLKKALANRASKVLKTLLAEDLISLKKTKGAKQNLVNFTKIMDDLRNEINNKIDTTFDEEELEKMILYFCNSNDMEMIHKLLSQSNGENIVCVAASRGLLNALSTLLACDMSPNSVDKDGMPALHNAVVDDAHLPVIKLLISKGALVNTCIKKYNETSFIGATPLHFAATFGHTYAAQLLIDYGADVTIKTDNDVTPLHVAVEMGCISIIQMLINKGADVNAQDTTQKTPLHYAPNNKDVVSILLACSDIDVNKKNIQGDTPLHTAMGKLTYKITLIEALLARHDIIINVENNDKKTPLDLVNSEHKQLKDLLIRHGAKTHDQLEGKSKQEKCMIQ